MYGKPLQGGFRMVVHSDMVCRAYFGAKTAPFPTRGRANEYHLFSVTASHTVIRPRLTVIGRFPSELCPIVPILSAYATQMGRSVVGAHSDREMPISPRSQSAASTISRQTGRGVVR